MSENRVRKSAAEREREGKMLIGVGLVIALLGYAIGGGAVGVVLGLVVAAAGGVMWAAGVARSD